MPGARPVGWTTTELGPTSMRILAPPASAPSRRTLLLGGISVASALVVGAGCETVDAQEVAAYLNELTALRNSTAADDAALGERFNALIASGSRDFRRLSDDLS